MQPLVSIVNATYNQSEWVRNLLDSIVRQDYPNIEVIVVGDGCTDDTEEVCRTFWKDSKRDFNMRYIENGRQGVQHARNRGLHEAKGKYVIFPDSDCYLRHDCITKMAVVLEDGRLSLPYLKPIGYVYCNMLNMPQDAKEVRRGIFRPGEFDPERLKRGNYIPSVTLMRREGCPEWDPDIKRHQDYDLWLSWLDKGFHGFWIDEDLFIHNTRSNSLTFTSVSIADANTSVWRKHGLM